MRQPIENLTTFDEFLEILKNQPENKLYELYDGQIIEMPLPKGKHEQIVAFLVMILGAECVRLKLEYGIPSKTLVKPENKQSGYFPDILLLNLPNLVNEPAWEDESIVSKPETIKLIIEVTSTNWRDDYHRKFADYEEMGIQEYWIVDYAAFGSRELIGYPKQPTITICDLNVDEGVYQVKRFRGNDKIQSPTFPELNLTAEQIFASQIKF